MKVRAAVKSRSGGRCETELVDICRGVAAHVHHVLRRSQGGVHVLENLLHVCWPCHSWIHDHPAEAAALGYLQLRGDV